MAGGSCGSEDTTDTGAARLPPAFNSSAGVGIDVVFTCAVDDPVDPMDEPSVDLAAIKLIATTCESDFNLCCGSVVSDVPTECVAALAEVVVEDSDEDDVVIVLPLASLHALFVGIMAVLSMMGDTGVFGTKCGWYDCGCGALFVGNCCCCSKECV